MLHRSGGVKFFFDRNVSEHLARMLSHIERTHAVVHQKDDNRFADTSTDVELVGTLADEAAQSGRRVVWLTNDLMQRKRADEREALRRSGLHVVFFRSLHKLSFHEQAIKLLIVWPNLVDACDNAKGSGVFEVSCGSSRSAKVDRLGDPGTYFKPRNGKRTD